MSKELIFTSDKKVALTANVERTSAAQTPFQKKLSASAKFYEGLYLSERELVNKCKPKEI